MMIYMNLNLITSLCSLILPEKPWVNTGCATLKTGLIGKNPMLPTSVSVADLFRLRSSCLRRFALLDVHGGDNVVLLTTSRVLSFWSNKLRLDWDLPFTHVAGVTIEDTGIRFTHKAGKDQDKFVFIPDKSSQSWFYDQISSVVRMLNLRRKMD